MAQTLSIYNNPLSGNLGNQTYKNYKGKQVVTTRFRTTSAKGDGASRAQRNTRMLMPNLTLIGSQIRDWLPALWENDKFYKRPYTHFLSYNMKRSLPVLPKELIDARCCCCGSLQISCGTLRPITYYLEADHTFWVDLQLTTTGTLDNITLGEFSRQIVSYNDGYNDGDFLVFVSSSYSARPVAEAFSPIVSKMSVSALKLDVTSTKSLASTWKGPNVYIKGVAIENEGTMLSIVNGFYTSWAVVHVVKSHGQYLASSQTLNTEFSRSADLAAMSNADYLDYCATSWGYRDKIL